MFWCCAGGSRKDKTRKEFVLAVADFEPGTVNRPSSIQQEGNIHDETASPDEETAHGVPQGPPLSPGQFVKKSTINEECPPSLSKAPALISKESELTDTTSSVHQTSMPTLMSASRSSYFQSEDSTHQQQPEWRSQSLSRHLPYVSANNQTELGLVSSAETRGWLDGPGQSEWIDETRSLAEISVRPDWINQAGSMIAPSARRDWIDEIGSTDLESDRSEWFDETESISAPSVRPRWLDETLSKAGDPEPSWMDRATALPAGTQLDAEWASPEKTRLKRPNSPEITKGGQSSAEVASRSPSEIPNSSEKVGNRGPRGTQSGSRTIHHIEGDSERSDEGGLLGILITDTNEKDALRRKHDKMHTSSAERARRVFSSSPAEEQASREGTAEAPAKITVIHRLKTLPGSDGSMPGARTKKCSREGAAIPRGTHPESGPNAVHPARPDEDGRCQPFDVAHPSDSPGEREVRVSTLAGDPETGSGYAAAGRGSSSVTRAGTRGEPDSSNIAPIGSSIQGTASPLPSSKFDTSGGEDSALAITPASKQEVKMWDPRAATAAAAAAAAAAAPAVLPLSKPIKARRGRQPLSLGTPRERRSMRKPTAHHLPVVDEEVTSTSPLAGSTRVAQPINVAEFSRIFESKKELGERLLAGKLRRAVTHGDPLAYPPQQTPREHVSIAKDISSKNDRARHVNAVKTVTKAPEMPMVAPLNPPKHAATSRRSSTEVENETGAGLTLSKISDKNETAKTWLARRSHRFSGNPFREDLPRRRGGSQRLSRSSSWDEASSSSFQGPTVMFSPGRFNPTSGVLSWSGSMDESLCDSSARSSVTNGTRNSSCASLVSARGPDLKLAPPQLSKNEKRTVERLKIKRSDVHFGYRTVGGSRRVYKIELNGEMRAAKVINTLGISKDEMMEVLDTFDAELLALSRLNTPHIVKVYGASVSAAEVILVSEFVDGGVLRRVLDNPIKLKRFNERVRLGIAKDVAMGMKSLYAHGMQHRHLSSNSILLTSDYRAKIVGVGLTMTTELIGFYTGEQRGEEEFEEELPWASREVLAGAGFSEKSDVYSFGIILWEIMQEDPCLPYDGLLPSQVVGAKYNGEGPPVPKHCPPAISRLMESCWSNLPSDRPSFEKICETLEAISL